MTDHYIMIPSMFASLKSVHGFTSMNGETYPQHICITFNDHLTEEQKKIIMGKNTQEALTYLKTLVGYTHNYENNNDKDEGDKQFRVKY